MGNRTTQDPTFSRTLGLFGSLESSRKNQQSPPLLSNIPHSDSQCLGSLKEDLTSLLQDLGQGRCQDGQETLSSFLTQKIVSLRRQELLHQHFV